LDLLQPEEHFVLNLGDPSDETTEKVLERFEFETKARYASRKEKIIIFAIGINDSEFIHSENNFLVLEKKFKENIQKLINIAQKFSPKIIFVGLTPVDESKVNPIPWYKDRSYRNEHIKKFNDIIKSVCEENKIYFIEIFENLIKTDYKKLLKDGVHPNSRGHRKIFEIVKDFLIKNKII
jgi:lysophospholipase L1-like esterase